MILMQQILMLSKKKSSTSNALTVKKKILLQQVSSDLKKGVKKLVSVLVNSILVIITKKEVFEIAEIAQATKTIEIVGASEDDEGGKYPRTNLARVSCI